MTVELGVTWVVQSARGARAGATAAEARAEKAGRRPRVRKRMAEWCVERWYGEQLDEVLMASRIRSDELERWVRGTSYTCGVQRRYAGLEAGERESMNRRAVAKADKSESRSTY